jgi:general transcriptional corepressor CYC8
LLGRAYMAGQKYNKAYEAYQQAVYRDGRNPTFWCSIGVLYFQINQFRDALDAYSRAIRINPYISEVWFDLGSLYESCNNQITDAIDAYARASELDPSNVAIAQRLQLLKTAQAMESAACCTGC